jgi:UDP-N-acetylglucosamine 2-epimerase (non-hydrolysing)
MTMNIAHSSTDPVYDAHRRSSASELPTVVQVIGARPNFVKMAPVVAALGRRGAFRQVVVHTEQHYDRTMSDEILDDLGFPDPDRSLGVGSGSHATQTGKVIAEFERVLHDEEPSLVVVAGDVNSTLGCALVAARHGVAVAHIEAGLRSFDWSMPEEVNRVLTDQLSDTLFSHSPEAEDNLLQEGIDTSCLHYVGNTMIDSLRRCEHRARAAATWRSIGMAEHEYVLVTLHRPHNVDDPERLAAIVVALCALAARHPVVFPIHPRTRARLSATGLLRDLEVAGVRCIDPVGYLKFLSLQAGAGAVITDSGGVQEETSALGVSCYTLRPNTERPVTLTHGTNVMLGDDPEVISGVSPSIARPMPAAIPLWDGQAAERVAEVLVAAYGREQRASSAVSA